MRVLVTGATGFIGANLVRILLERGQQVRVLRRASSPQLVLEGLPLEVVTGSLTQLSDMKRAVSGCDQVYHLAGAYESGAGAEARMLECHDVGTRTLGEAALRAGVSRMVVCSSSVTLPFGSIDAPASEEDLDPYAGHPPPYRGTLLVYYLAKRAQERIALELCSLGLETVIVNPDFVIGPWDIKPSSGAIILQVARVPWLPFYPPGGKSFIRARDCAEGHVLAMERGRPGQRYLLGDHNMRYGDALKIIARVVGRPSPGLELSPRMLEGAAWLEQYLQRYFPQSAPMTSRLEATFMGRYRSPEKARRELGLGSSPFEVAVEEAWHWFKDHGYV